MLTIARRVVRKIPLAIVVFWTLAPFIIILSVSLKTRQQVFAQPGIIPDPPTLDAYTRTLALPSFQSAFTNSVVLGIATLLLTLVLSVPAAYAFARFGFRGRHLLLLFVLLPLLVPKSALMVPLFRLASTLGVMNSRFTLTVVFAGTVLPLATWLLIGFFQQIPMELEEAASVDGASLWDRWWRIVMPLALPALVTIGILAFREAWHEFELVIALTSSQDMWTLPYTLWRVGDSAGGMSDRPGEAAFALLTIVPFLLVYSRIERYVVQGMMSGSGK